MFFPITVFLVIGLVIIIVGIVPVLPRPWRIGQIPLGRSAFRNSIGWRTWRWPCLGAELPRCGSLSRFLSAAPLGLTWTVASGASLTRFALSFLPLAFGRLTFTVSLVARPRTIAWLARRTGWLWRPASTFWRELALVADG